MDLREELDVVAPYPNGVIPVPEAITGNAFFPGGTGLWQGRDNQLNPTVPVGGVMILGHDFHSEEGYTRSRKHGSERLTDPTWRNLLALFEDASVDPATCFFTNFYMGLRAKGQGATGRFPGSTDPGFVSRCGAFFTEQLNHQKPKAILVLGIQVPPLLATLSPQLGAWKAATRMVDIDAGDGAVARDVSFPNAAPVRSVAVLTHPSQRRLNVHRRAYDGLSGHAAEVRLIQECLERL